MWYYPTENVLRTHGCSLPISNAHQNNHAQQPQKENPVFAHPTAAFTLYQPAPQHSAGSYGIIGLPPQVSMQEFFINPVNSASPVTR